MESTDKLNEFVDLNREQFDCFEPSPELWDKIEVKQHRRHIKQLTVRTMMKIAAAVVILFGTYVGIQKGLNHSNQIIANQLDTSTNMQIAEYKEAQLYYSAELKTKLDELKQNAKQYPEVLTDAYSELHALDNELQRLQKDLQDGVESKEIVSAMIQNYKSKLDIITKINEVINEQEAQKKELHHEI